MAGAAMDAIKRPARIFASLVCVLNTIASVPGLNSYARKVEGCSEFREHTPQPFVRKSGTGTEAIVLSTHTRTSIDENGRLRQEGTDQQCNECFREPRSSAVVHASPANYFDGPLMRCAGCRRALLL